jgi:cytochrome c1
VLGLHERFLDTCLKQCLLASQDLLKILTKLMTTCLLFADQMKRFMTAANSVTVSAAPLPAATAAATATAATSTSGTTAATTAKPSGRGDGGSAMSAAEIRRATVAKQAAADKARLLAAKAEYIRTETSHSAFLHMLGKFEDTFDTQVIDQPNRTANHFFCFYWFRSYRILLLWFNLITYPLHSHHIIY